jgi:molecular chaperone DnaK
VPQIEVTFDIDANGILNVSAKDVATGKTQNITITASSGLGKDEVEKMVREAQSHADEDKKRRELVDLRNQADSLAYSLEKTLKDSREKVADGEAREIDEAIAGLRKAAEGEDAAALKQQVDRVTALSHKLAESLYKAAAPAGGAGPAGGSAPGDAAKGDDVVDAEYTVKD